MTTISCPRCYQPVDGQAITCPYCRTTLKAYGHPGIPLHRATGKEYLCDSCTYHMDNTCNFPQRPYAKDCTLYENLAESKLILPKQLNPSSLGARRKNWVKRNQFLLLLLSLLFVCFLIALSSA
ncbi:zinc ribbon domain-containing protein [Chrysosporum ovalisporum APH033B]|uniref:zinc ribbon domain-containing protein n=1 Tax=Umezakia ovalisporum TaxID=75695 RepID=UPI0024738350|nr:zinc ribbon domain-containing protein [Umezakia ovalisporum]MDH6068170.1 zinc ribbon domain-containing protein [Umezakia ovalisporum APH033B]MDH6078583.1 zinc ribbon domain-containing protein [Umezakia ovalisporum FSS-45]MDH6101291.1 zinc ribbon domain-containing protein [Umezakia ovalisporum ANA283AFssAo]